MLWSYWYHCLKRVDMYVAAEHNLSKPRVANNTVEYGTVVLFNLFGLRAA